MKNKIFIGVLLMLIMGLGANLFHIRQKLTEIKNETNPDAERLSELEHQKKEWDAKEYDLLRQNGELVVQVNELKKQLEKKPTIIKIKSNEKRNVNADASDEFNRILSRRYGVTDNSVE